MNHVYLISVFVIATCGLIYELIAGALASYLLGDSVLQFSTVIGVYLFSMGLGSYFSKYVGRNVVLKFILVEILIGLVGGFSACILFLSFEWVSHFRVLLYSLVVLTGTLVGFEIPLLMRIMKDQFEFKDLVSKVFTFDYVGALLASLLFPLVLVPYLGLMRSSFLFGVINVLVAIWTLFLFRKDLPWVRTLKVYAFTSLIVLVLGFSYSEKLLSFAEQMTYSDPVVYSEASPYQKVVITRSNFDFKLFLNGNLQFSSRDEYRYHESLVHVPALMSSLMKNVLVMGGGDGLAARELLRYPEIESIDLVDLDPLVTRIFSQHADLQKLNKNSLRDSKVNVINEDAFIWIEKVNQKYDLILIDFPDPSNFSVGKLYTDTFYRKLKAHMHEKSIAVVQSTSPFVAKQSFWCVDSTLKSVGFNTLPYHAFVPAFGDWGYILFGLGSIEQKRELLTGLQYLSADLVPTLFKFGNDQVVVSSCVHKLNNQKLVSLFEKEWGVYAR
jgi:spermidine synthase